MKYAILLLLIFALFYYFFRPKKKTTRINEEVDTMYECAECGVFVSKSEMLFYRSRIYCSKECKSKAIKKEEGE